MKRFFRVHITGHSTQGHSASFEFPIVTEDKYPPSILIAEVAVRKLIEMTKDFSLKWNIIVNNIQELSESDMKDYLEGSPAEPIELTATTPQEEERS